MLERSFLMANLTAKQQQIYDYILAFTAEHGYPPSVREIGAAVGLKSPSTVHFHMKGLEEAGVIVKAEGKTRAKNDLKSFVNERWKGMYPICWGDTLRESEYSQWIYSGVCGLESEGCETDKAE